MRRFALAYGLAASATLATTAAIAVDDPEPSPTLDLRYEVEATVPDLGVTVSPSGRYAAWKEGDRIRLLDGRSGEILDMAGPPLALNERGPNVRLNDKFLVWRVVTNDWRERTDLLVYKILSGQLVTAYDAAGINDDPYLFGGTLLWESGLTAESTQHILAFDAWNDVLENLTPESERVEWLTGDGPIVAWAEGPRTVPGFDRVWAMDLRSRQRWLLDEGVEVSSVRVTGTTIQWRAQTDPVETRVAFLRRSPCGELGPELALVAPLFARRRRK